MGLFDIFKVCKIKKENAKLRTELNEKDDELKLYIENFNAMKDKINNLGVTEYYKIKEMIKESKDYLNDINIQNTEMNKKNLELTDELYKLNKSIESQTKKLSKIKELYKSVNYFIKEFLNDDIPLNIVKSSKISLDELETISPSTILKLHCMDVKDLKKEYNNNDKLIDELLKHYSSRYTTKSNKAIYNLMVIALKAELQNVLYDLKYEKLDKGIENIKSITNKYLKIASEGNQSIVGTLTKFIGEIEYLFINAVKIEYNYYVKKEQAKQEQLAIKQQMKEEIQERKALGEQQKKIEKEEKKFNLEILKIKETLSTTSNEEEVEHLKNRILELQTQLSKIENKKEEISNLQNGKAGNVYIISNLGSFGENIFKIGMTRRIDPQERIDELSNASVPFKFDVHSFIFCDDAVNLEKKLHDILKEKRVNKVNLRKEFFYISLDELENLVSEIDPTAEFNKTMYAEEFKQSQCININYVND